uniref:Uncharacterized protein n=1 Tax=Anguilla anguilla TaxID=7936 RepID=A0A0E9VY31_ANGAN
MPVISCNGISDGCHPVQYCYCCFSVWRNRSRWFRPEVGCQR